MVDGVLYLTKVITLGMQMLDRRGKEEPLLEAKDAYKEPEG